MAPSSSKQLRLHFVLWFATMVVCICHCCLSLSATTFEAIPVFAGQRLALVHFFCSVPIACLAACRVRHRWPVPRFAFLVAAAMTLLLPHSLELFSWTLRQMEAGLLIRTLVRCILGFAMVFVWIVCLPFPLAWRSKEAWSWTILIWLSFPSVYAWKQSEIGREDFQSSLDGMKVLQALRSLERSVEMGGLRMVRGVGEDEWRRKLKVEVATAEESLAHETADRSLESHLQRAMQCMSLSRYAEAQHVLLEAKSGAPQVLLLLAISAREQKDYRSVEVLTRKLLTALPLNDTDVRPMSFQLLGEVLVRQREIGAAIAVYEQAIAQCPSVRGEFEMRLGTLLSEAGDTSGAMEYFEKAARAEPKLSQESKTRIRGLKTNRCHF